MSYSHKAELGPLLALLTRYNFKFLIILLVDFQHHGNETSTTSEDKFDYLNFLKLFQSSQSLSQITTLAPEINVYNQNRNLEHPQ